MDLQNVLAPMAKLLGMFLVLVFIVYPLVLSGTNKLVNGFWSSYGRTLVTVILTGIAATIVTGVVGLVIGKDAVLQQVWLIRAVAVITTALAGGGIMKAFIHHQDGEPLGYARTLLASLVLGIVVMLIGMAIAPWQKPLSAQIKAATEQTAAAHTAPATAATALAAPTTVSQAVAVKSAVAASAPATATSAY